MTSVEATWQAPGPGQWDMDEAHQSAPYSTYLTEQFKAHANAGIREASSRYGALIDHFDIAVVGGWQFVRPRIVGAPEKPGPLPPRWLFGLLFRIHPGLRNRARSAREAVRELRWRVDAEWWLEQGRESLRAKLQAVQAVELAELDASQLAAHLAEVESVLADGWRTHFRNAIAHWIGVGDWLAAAAEWTDTAPEEALAALTGSSPSSIETIGYLDRVAAAVKTSDVALAALRGPGEPQERLRTLGSASVEVAAALNAYLDEYGWRIYTGFDIADKATVELPGSILESIAARLEPGDDEPTEESTADKLRESVPVMYLSDYDKLFETARVLYGLRDDDAGPCFHWTSGLARRALLEIGARLQQGGRIEAQEHIFDATPDEVRGLLMDPASAVSAADLASRNHVRLTSASVRPPGRLGEDEGPPPPDEWLPPAVARVNRALMTAMAVEYPAAEGKVVAEGKHRRLTGLAGGSGSYEGRACVVLSPDDFAKLRSGDVLVAPFTTTAYNSVLPLIGGVVTDKGGILSHAAIVAREYAIPAVVNTVHGTAYIRDGDRVRVDGTTGTVELLQSAPQSDAPARAAAPSAEGL